MSEDQQNLVSVLYSVHNKLRQKKHDTRDNDEEWERAWKEHTSDTKTLQEYSKAMHALATKIWDPRNKSSAGVEEVHQQEIEKTSSKLKCRLEWVVSRCNEYFDSKARANRLRLLDVGSCYNPFSQFHDLFEIVALDLCPAPGFEDEVFQCDFTDLKVVEEDSKEPEPLSLEKKSKSAPLKYLQKAHFDVIVFSYFLEYLADTRQRQQCCEKAYDLLASNGLLFILRPDSNKVTPGGNNVIMKKMKVAMGILGFKRIYFEKLEHLWCMGFKKLEEEEKDHLIQSSLFKKDVQKVGVDFVFHNQDRLHELFCISQDIKVNDDADHNVDECEKSKFCSDVQFELELLGELPNFHL